MKALFTLLVTALLWCPALYAQTHGGASITLDMPNASMSEIIEKLRQLGMSVSNSPGVEKYTHIHLSVHHARPEEVLKQVVTGLPLGYIFIDADHVVVYEVAAAQHWKYAVLPRDTLKPPFSNGYVRGGAAGNVAAYGVVSAEELEQTVSSNLLDHLEGRVNGLTKGGQTNPLGFSIRGNTTLLGTGTPLIAVGPFAYTENILDINTYDLQSVTVLKDAAAAGVWGAYSGNGVLEYTPKEGDYNKRRVIDVVVNTTVAERPNLFYPSWMSPRSYINADSILFSNGFFDSYVYDPLFVLPPSVQMLYKARWGQVSAADANAAIAAMAKHNLNQDLDRYYYQTSAVQEYHLSMEGGTPDYKYYIGGGYNYDPTDLVRNRWQRSTLNGSYIARSDDGRWEGGASGNLAVVNTLNNNTGDVPVAYPYARLADAQGRPLAVASQYNQFFIDTAAGSYPESWAYVPLRELALADNRSTRVDFFLQGNVGFHFHRGWTAEVLGRWTHGHSASQNIFSKDGFYVRSLVNSYSQPTENGKYTLPIPDDNILQSADTTLSAYNIRGTLTYSDSSEDASSIWQMRAGAEVSDAETSGEAQRFYGYSSAGASTPMDLASVFRLRPTGGSSPIPTNDTLVAWSNRAVSFFSSGAYTWKRDYNFYAALRLDASNIAGSSNARKWSPFWSLGASRMFRLRRGAGGRGSLVKARLGFGCNGNVSNRTNYLGTESIGVNTYNVPQLAIIAPPDPTLGWERVYTLNVGADFHVLRDSANPRGRLSGSLDLYERWATNLLCYDSLAPSAGITSYMANAAAITGQGIELTLHSVNVARGKFLWTSLLLVEFNRDWVSKYPYTAKAPSSYVMQGFVQKGEPSTSYYSYGWAGLDPTNGDPQGWLNKTASKVYPELVGDPRASKICSGGWQPKVTMSLLNELELGRVSLSIRLDCRTGYVVRRPSIEYFSLADNFYRGTRDYDDRWQSVGQKTSVPSMPVVPDRNRDEFYEYSQVLITRADNIRLRDLRLGYKWTLGEGPLKTMVVYVYCKNMALLWKANHYGVDPDAAAYGALPAQRTYSLGVHFTM